MGKNRHKKGNKHNVQANDQIENKKKEQEAAKAEETKTEEAKVEEAKAEEAKADDATKVEETSKKEEKNSKDLAESKEEQNKKEDKETSDSAEEKSEKDKKEDSKDQADEKQSDEKQSEENKSEENKTSTDNDPAETYVRKPWERKDIIPEDEEPYEENKKSKNVVLMQSALDKRLERKKRRKRNQTIAYLTLVLVLLLLATGVFNLINMLRDMKTTGNTNQTVESSQVEEILTSEESIEAPSEELPSEEPVEPELTYEEKLDEIVNAGIEVMPLEDKVAGLFLVSPEAITGVETVIQAGEGTKEALAQKAVGGLIYNKKNMKSEEQLKEMIQNTKEYSKYPLFIAVTEEGGPVSNLNAAELTEKVAGASEIGQGGVESQAYEAGNAIGTYLEAYGFNLDMGPVVDLATNSDSPMYSRSYSADGTVVSTMAGNMIQGLKEHQISACIKHFPGAGSAIKTGDNGRTSSAQTAEEFAAADLIPFQSLVNSGVDMIMVSSMLSGAWDEREIPCCFSSSVVKEILREQMGYDGVVITDALNEQAITDYYAADEAAVMALKAGCDMIYMPEDFEQAYQGVLKAVQDGVISEDRIDDALRRIYRIKYASMVSE